MAHKGIIDKNRRELILKDSQVENILPEYFLESYPKLVAFLNAYYEFENEHDLTELLNHLYESRDLVAVDETLLEFIEDELLLGQTYFEGPEDRRSASEFSSTLFRAKGSKYSIQWFFRTFFDEDPEVVYPKENVFLVGVSEIGPQSLRYITDDKLYQTFSILINVGLSSNKWKELYKLFIHPAGMYLANQVVVESETQGYIFTPDQVGGNWKFGSDSDATIAPLSTTAYAEVYGIQLVFDRYSISVDNIVEGNPINATITAIGDAPTSATLGWAMSGTEILADTRITTKSDTIILTTSPETVELTTTTASDAYEGLLQGTVTLTGSGVEPATDTFTIVDGNAAYTLTPNTSFPVEGQTVTFNVGGTSIPDGLVYFWIEHGTSSDADFTLVPPSSQYRRSILISNGVGTTSVILTGDDGEDVNETFTAYISTSAANAPNSVANTGVITIQDDGVLPPVYAISPYSPISVDEGTSTIFNFSGANLIEGTTVYFGIDESSTTQDADFTVTPYKSGSRLALTVTGGVLSPSSFSPTLTADGTVDGFESFSGSLYTANTGGVKLATSSLITVNDTSVPFTLALSNPVTTIYENNAPQSYTIAATGGDGTTVYWRVVDGTTSPADFTGPTSGSVVIASNTASFSVAALADSITDGQNETFTIEIDTDPGFGSVYDSVVVTIVETSVGSPQNALFTSSTTWVVPNNVTSITVHAAGGGGGGGGNYSSGDEGQSSGGGSGAYQNGIVKTVVPGETITITIGDGGISGAIVYNGQQIWVNGTTGQHYGAAGDPTTVAIPSTTDVVAAGGGGGGGYQGWNNFGAAGVGGSPNGVNGGQGTKNNSPYAAKLGGENVSGYGTGGRGHANNAVQWFAPYPGEKGYAQIFWTT